MSCMLGCTPVHSVPGEDEQQVDVTLQSVPDFLIIFGQITDCAKNNQPVSGALVKVFKCVNKKMIGICHTFSGHNGFYMLNVPPPGPGEKLLVMSTCSCSKIPPCPPCSGDAALSPSDSCHCR